MKIQMVDLLGQYQRLKPEIDAAMAEVLDSSAFINGPAVAAFARELADFQGVNHVVTCGNGTDALQIALMALDLQPGDEVVVPAFTYVAAVEVIALLGLVPVFAEVEADSFMLSPEDYRAKISHRTKAVIPVHLFGQCADMEAILTIASEHNLAVIEDAAQAIGATYTFRDGSTSKAGTMGTIGTTSFFPSKNLGCFGDGGALFVKEAALAEKVRMIANHGQRVKYHHDIVGINSRLDTLQAAVLRVKLSHLTDFNMRRNHSAALYDAALGHLNGIQIPQRVAGSTHVFHQYTLLCHGCDREELKAYLQSRGIPTMVYYPVPVHLQPAYRRWGQGEGSFPVAEQLAAQVLSLPIHTEQTEEELHHITDAIKAFFAINHLN